jgi:hypothetical protein
MDCRRAVLNAIRFVRRRLSYIGDRAVDRLLAGAPVRAEHRRLASLLSAAAGPARGHELVGEQALLDAYVEAGRCPSAPAARPARTALTTLIQAVAVRVAIALAALAVGGAAVAAQTGHLPAAAQQTAHKLLWPWGVPAPATSGSPTGQPAGDRPRPSVAPTTKPAPRHGGPTSPPPGHQPVAPPTHQPGPPPAGEARVRDLCTLFVRHERTAQSRPLTAEERRELATAVDGENNIRPYCERLLGVDNPSERRATPTPTTGERTGPRRASGPETSPEFDSRDSPSPSRPAATQSPRRVP